MSKPRKHRTTPVLSGVPGTPGNPDYPPITAANCADLAFARKLVRQMRSDRGGRPHRRDRLRRASRSTHEAEAEHHLYRGAYTIEEQQARDQNYPLGHPPDHVLRSFQSHLDSLRLDRISFDDHLYVQPRDIWLETLAEHERPSPHWNCDWLTAFDQNRLTQIARARAYDRARAASNRPARSARRSSLSPEPFYPHVAQLFYPPPVPSGSSPTHINGHPLRSRWQDCSIGDTVHAHHFPIAIDDPLANHPLTLHWPVNDQDTTRTFAQYRHSLWLRVA